MPPKSLNGWGSPPSSLMIQIEDDERDYQPTSFLDLPEEVRTRIYRLAIYDHDRGAVFLPRAVPRKVEPDTDVDMKIANVVENPGESPVPYFAWPVNEGQSLASGVWYDSLQWPSMPVHQPLQQTRDRERFEEGHEEIADTRVPGDLDALLTRIGIDPQLWHESNTLKTALEQLDSPEGSLDCSSDSSSELEANAEDQDHDRDPFSRQRLPPEACLRNECNDQFCEHCAGRGLDFVDWDEEEAQKDDEEASKWYTGEHEDDMEHEDADEREGMLYELSEPAILLACKEIRDECRLVYYASNSFSWRFLWQQYDTSLERFRHWARGLQKQDAQAITRLTFEGRHGVEEGIEFVADVDLFKEWPYFKIKVSFDDHADWALSAISDTLEKELIWTVWGWLSTQRPPLALIPERIVRLGEVFVKVMRSEPDMATNDGEIWRPDLPGWVQPTHESMP